MTVGGPTYIPHLRRWITWEYDTDDWPFVPLTDDEETDAQRVARMTSLGYVLRYGQHWLEVPRPDEPDYAEYHKNAVNDYLRDMTYLGYWDIEVRGWEVRPIAKTVEFKVSDFPAHATLAHVMHRARLFPSVGEARRNGWNKPIAPGDYVVGKDKRRIKIAPA